MIYMIRSSDVRNKGVQYFGIWKKKSNTYDVEDNFSRSKPIVLFYRKCSLLKNKTVQIQKKTTQLKIDT